MSLHRHDSGLFYPGGQCGDMDRIGGFVNHHARGTNINIPFGGSEVSSRSYVKALPKGAPVADELALPPVEVPGLKRGGSSDDSQIGTSSSGEVREIFSHHFSLDAEGISSLRHIRWHPTDAKSPRGAGHQLERRKKVKPSECIDGDTIDSTDAKSDVASENSTTGVKGVPQGAEVSNPLPHGWCPHLSSIHNLPEGTSFSTHVTPAPPGGWATITGAGCFW